MALFYKSLVLLLLLLLLLLLNSAILAGWRNIRHMMIWRVNNYLTKKFYKI